MQGLDVFQDFKTHHLLLLIGENPLPNYVAAKLLLKPGGIIHLAHTTGTYRQCKQLSEKLKADKINCQDLPLGDFESNATEIRAKIQQRIKQLQLSDSKIGLHYTGGTKAMSVHAYLTVKEYQPNAIFSYLNPRRLELCFDQTSGDPRRVKLSPTTLQISIQDLVGLHGWDLCSHPLTEPIHPEAASAFADFHANSEAATSWRTWCDSNLRKSNRNFKSKTNLQGVKIDLDDNCKILNDSRYIIREALQSFDRELKEYSLQEILDKTQFNDFQKLAEWIDSFWLEHYTLSEVQKIKNLDIYGSVNSLKLKNPTTGSDKFEIDVVFTRGYQLFAISCTTSANKSLCKSKLFEAYIRAQQLGGAEARVALVCCTKKEDTQSLKTEVVNTFTPIGSVHEDFKLEMFGVDDLRNLGNKISEWIQNVDLDAK
jgi:hypothetical protein